MTSPWRNSKVVATLALVFFTGAVAGALWNKLMMAPAASPSPAMNQASRDVTVERFRKELKLNDAQAAKLELVLDDFMKYYQTLQSQMDDVRSAGREQILQVLDDSQKERFNQLMMELHGKQKLR
jgi:hypothetical protein